MKHTKVIIYNPKLREYVGSINAALLVASLEQCFSEMGQGFNKFLEPCGHEKYVPGESWIEALHMTTTEFRTAFKYIGVVYKSKKEYNLSRDKFQGKMYLSYYDRLSKLTYYMRNDDLVDRVLDEVEDQTTVEHTEVIKAELVEDRKAVVETRNQEFQDGIIDYKTKINTNTNTKRQIKTQSKSDTCNPDIEQSLFKTGEASRGDLPGDTPYIQDSSDNDSKQDKDFVPFEKIKELFNQICQSHDPILEWSMTQKQKIKMLWDRYDQALEVFEKAFQKLEASDFLSGRIKAWKAQLDWLFKPGHFSDVLANKYRNFREKSKNYSKALGQMVSDQIHSHEWDFDEIEILERKRIDQILERQLFEIG